MKLTGILCFTGFFVGLLSAQTIDVGGGAATAGIRISFLNAWSRNGFNTLVGDPKANVASYGSVGLIQQFPAISGSGTLALIKADSTDNNNTYQVLASMFAYFPSVGVGTAGYPSVDTAACPPLLSTTGSGNSCLWQLFSNNYALFVYAKATPSGGLNFATRDPFYSKWTTLNGISGLGPANTAEASVTSQYSTKATVQTYDQGAIYNITSGLTNGRILAVEEPIYDLYVSLGAHNNTLGLPVTDALIVSSTLRRQTFEGGSIDWDTTTGLATLRPAINRISLTPSGSIQMKAGDTLPAQVTLFSLAGDLLTDRIVSWNTSNGQVVQIVPTGLTATIKAIGGGTATVTVTAEGKTSGQLNVTVISQCCLIGEGSPTPGIQQAFRDAVTRNNLSVQLPAASAVTRLGNGYVQTLLGTGASPVTYLVAVEDESAAGYVVSGAILAQYLTLGGPSGSLGFPVGDATAGGRQSFEQGALAGNPVQLVSGAILAKWAKLGYETGSAGQVAGSATVFQTFRGTAGLMQFFANALIAAPTNGPLAGQAFAVTGPVLTAYVAAGGPTGDLGSPLNDQRLVNGLNQQDFEGGSINYATGSQTANITKNPRQPVITTKPGAVIGGSFVHLVVGGFPNGDTVRVSQTGQLDFTVTVASGAYVWDVWVPASAAAGTVTVTATDTKTNSSATASYTIRSADTAPLSISVVSGDEQDGAPGATLPKPLVVVVQDQDGNPAPGRTVTFAASPGAQVTPATAVTAADGTAKTSMRLPPAGGIALATASAGHDVVTFSAQSDATALTNFPQMNQAVDGNVGNGSDPIRTKGALLTATASIVKYYQQLASLPQSGGVASPTALNQFLKTFCVPGTQICDGFVSLTPGSDQIVNLWRVGAFTGASLEVHAETATPDIVRDLVVAGFPVLLEITLASGGMHFVDAYGIASDGSILISDPNPTWAQTNLMGYLNGFTSGGATIKGSLTGAIRLLPQPLANAEFVAVANAPISLTSVSGPCAAAIQILDSTGARTYFAPCDGASAPYDLEVASSAAFSGTVTGLSNVGGQAPLSGTAPASYLVSVNGSQYAVGPITTSIFDGGVVNAASFTADIAPGELISIFGTGLAQSGANTAIQVNGQTAPIIAVAGFQANAQLPASIPAGSATLTITAGNNTTSQPLTVKSVAPSIFSTGPGQAAITNQDNTLNTPFNPSSRNRAIVIYSTGLGATTTQGGLSRANATVSVVIAGTEMPSAFAGLTPGFIGLDQVNVNLPAALAPGLALPLYLKQAGTASNTVTVAVQ
jgi:uncharacterized protein (TIGR03437 family)